METKRILPLVLPRSVCQVHPHYCYFHHQCVLSCAAVCSLVIVLHRELVALQPCEPFTSQSFSLIYSQHLFLAGVRNHKVRSLGLWCCHRCCLCKCASARAGQKKWGWRCLFLQAVSLGWVTFAPRVILPHVSRMRTDRPCAVVSVPTPLLASEWVRHGYQQQARTALVSASPNKGSTHCDIYKCTAYTKHGRQVNTEPELFIFSFRVLYYGCKTVLEFRGTLWCLSDKQVAQWMCVFSFGYQAVGLWLVQYHQSFATVDCRAPFLFYFVFFSSGNLL